MGMQCCRTATVPRVKRLQHVSNLGASDLPHDEPVWSHAKGLSDQTGHADLTGTFDICLACFQADNVRMVNLNFG
jgi:hypothetical protein